MGWLIMSFLMFLVRVLQGLEALRNKFFLVAEMDEKKIITWIIWKKVLTHQNNGGLGACIFLP